MYYRDLLRESNMQFLRPIVWQMPGTKSRGRTIFYNGAARIVGDEVRQLTDQPVLLVIGRHIRKGETGQVVCRALEEAGVKYDIFTDFSPEPHLEDARRMETYIKEKKYGAVIGAGGGSAMDMAKFAVHGIDGRLVERIENHDFSESSIPLVLLPTTAGTGSEISPYAVLTMNEKKVFFSSPSFLAAIAIIDPLLTVFMPEETTAATAFDAMTHALEGGMAASFPYTECLAVESAAQILRYLPKVLEDGANLEGRYYLALASVMGMMAYVMGGGLYAHSISYILTLEKGLPHGAGCGLALPYTLAMNETFIPDLLDGLSYRCFGSSGTQEMRRNMIEEIRRVFVETKLPGTLKELGYVKGDILGMADKLYSQYYRVKNPRSISQTEAEKLLNAMLSGEIQYF